MFEIGFNAFLVSNQLKGSANTALYIANVLARCPEDTYWAVLVFHSD